MEQATEHFILIKPEQYFRMDTKEGRQVFLEWLEGHLAEGREFVGILAGGFALFRKVTNKIPAQYGGRIGV